MGGIYARLFAAREPAVRALVMMDTYDPDLGMDEDPALPVDVRAAIRQSIADTGGVTQQVEQLDWDAMVAELPPVTELPGFMLADDPHNNFVNPDPAIPAAMIDAWYRAIAAHYPQLRLEIVANSGHFVHQDQPALVLARVRTVLDEVNGT
jgi:pimeloyl-ACP methyl ester carboxylesterase